MKELIFIVFGLLLSSHSINAHNITDYSQRLENTEAGEVLLKAAETGNLETIRALLKKGVSLEARDEKGNTALHIAAEYKNEDILTELLSYGMEVDIENDLGESPLIVISAMGHTAMAKTLLKFGANPNLQGYNGTPLSYAISQKQHLMLQLLLDSGANPHHAIHNNLTPLMVAVDNLNFKATKILLSASVDINQLTTREGHSALSYAVKRNSYGMTKVLLATREVKLNLRKKQGPTPLILAIGAKDKRLATTIIEAGADVNMTYKIGRTLKMTALMWAATLGKLEVGKALLREGAIVSSFTTYTSKEKAGWSAVHFAAYNKDLDFLKMLEANKADLKALTRRSESILLLASKKYAGPALVSYIVSRGIPVDTQDLNGNTALMEKAKDGDLKSVILLLAKGANPLLTDRTSKTAYYYAIRYGHYLVALEIKKHINP